MFSVDRLHFHLNWLIRVLGWKCSLYLKLFSIDRLHYCFTSGILFLCTALVGLQELVGTATSFQLLHVFQNKQHFSTKQYFLSHYFNPNTFFQIIISVQNILTQWKICSFKDEKLKNFFLILAISTFKYAFCNSISPNIYVRSWNKYLNIISKNILILSGNLAWFSLSTSFKRMLETLPMGIQNKIFSKIET